MALDHANSFLFMINPFIGIEGLPLEIVNSIYAFVVPLGRLAFPIFAFFIAEGCKYTKNPQRYVARLLVFALISELPFQWMHGTFSLIIRTSNVMFTLALGALACLVYTQVKDGGHPLLALLPPLGFIIVGELARTDYGSLGVLLVFIAYLFTHKLLRLLAMGVVLSWLYLISAGFMRYNGLYQFSVWANWVAALLALVLLAFYTNQRGRKVKWLFYIFYPVHMLVIALVRFIG